MPSMPPPPSSPPLMLLVHRPGRSIALAAGATFGLVGALLLAYQLSASAGRPWLNLLLLVPIIVGFVAIMRTGTTRCEVAPDEHQLVLRSIDSSQLLGRTREATFRWSDVRALQWVGEDHDELRVDFARTPRALVFSGGRRDLTALHAAITQRRGSA